MRVRLGVGVLAGCLPFLCSCGSTSQRAEGSNDGHATSNGSTATPSGNTSSTTSTNGSNSVSSSSGGSAGSTGNEAVASSGGSGGEPTSTTGGVDDPDPSEVCSAAPGDHTADCGDACDLELDLVVSCDDADLGSAGLRVAANAQGTYLASTSRNAGWVAELGADRFEPHALPEAGNAPLQMALAPSGEVHVAHLVPRTVGYSILEASGLHTEQVVDFDTYSKSPLDLLVDAQGDPALWITIGGTPGSYARGRRDAATGWSVEEVFPFVRKAGTRFTLSQSEQPVTYYTENGLHVHYQGQDEIVTSAPGEVVPAAYQPGGEGADVAFVFHGTEGISAWFAAGAGYDEVALPNTATLQRACDGSTPFGSQSCDPQTCIDEGSGVLAVAADRALDGALWVAYLYQHTHLEYEYHLVNCGAEVGCMCAPSLTADNSSFELYLLRVHEGGPATTELSLPIDPVYVPGTSGGVPTRSLDLDIGDDALAIGLSLQDRSLRVLRLNIAP